MESRFLQNIRLQSSKRTRGDDGKRESQSKKLKVERKEKGKEQAVDAEISQRSPTCSSSESGLFSNHQVQTSQYTSSEASASPAVANFPSVVGSTYTLVVEGVERVLCITQVIFRSKGLIERGTNVFEVECIKEESVLENGQRTTITPEQSWKARPLVLKISFPPSERTSEGELIRAARKHAKDNNSDWALKHLPLVVAYIDNLDWESNDPNQKTLLTRLKSHLGDAYESCSLRSTVLEKLEPLSSLNSAREFAQVFYDILQIHRWLYEHPGILHRDLSMANIMYRREGDNVYGVLNDFDLSSFRTRMDEGPHRNIELERSHSWLTIFLTQLGTKFIRLHSLSHKQFGLIPNMEPCFFQDVKLKSSKRARGDDDEQESHSKKSKVDGKGKGKEQAVDAGISERSLSSSKSGLFLSYQVETSEHTSTKASAPPAALPAAAKLPSLVGSTYTLVVEEVERVLCITRVIFRSDGLIGRGTSVLDVDCIQEENVSENGERTTSTITPEHSWKARPLVLKLSFPPSGRTSEGDLICAARKHARDNDSDWALKHLPLVVACVDNPDGEVNDPKQTTLQGRLKSQFKDAYEMRSLRATVLEKLEPLSSLKSAREFAQVFYDILQIHRWLYEHPRILHRDLSMANIMYRRAGDNVYGVLNDFDLSSFRTCMDEGPTSKHRTGTKPFMARDLLHKDWDKVHRYRHDLESLFYIILILSCHYSNPTTHAPNLQFSRWFDGADHEIAYAKLDFLESAFPKPPVQTYFETFHPWLYDIRQMLGMGYLSRPYDPHGLECLYDWETLNGNITFKKVMEVMGSFNGEKLVTRWAGGNSGN
ncbi:hypothetical protein D9757_013022 [Collybiopsis confluens]|uniref:Protein kinase domain-containing protein n=1 Tax=Collybiopsis confluens TaxID=2823264 RepID=A0A8H5LIG0_9AGAR|nr:hypothetical protein D9757_013022 [Collybiopsis confluens]